jgi:hypothetical protein
MYEDDIEQPLTPSHLCLGRRYCSLQSNTGNDDPTNDMERAQILDALQKNELLLQHFWKRWENEYLINLREAHNPNSTSKTQIAKGDVVILKDENTKRSQWRLAVIQELIKGDDGKTRGAVIRLAEKGRQPTTLKRPIQHLIPLEIRDSGPFPAHIENLDREEVKEQEDDRSLRKTAPASPVSDDNTSTTSAANSDDDRISLSGCSSDTLSSECELDHSRSLEPDIAESTSVIRRQRRVAAIDGEIRRRITSTIYDE